MRILILGAATTGGYASIHLNRRIDGGGWVENLLSCLQETGRIDEIHAAFYTDAVDCVTSGEVDGVCYHALPAWIRDLRDCNQRMLRDLETLSEQVRPDVLHIIGTERRYAYELARMVGMHKTVVSVTGLVSVLEKHAYGGIDVLHFALPSLGDILRGGGPVRERRRFIRQGRYERKLLQQAECVMGRTTWDYACATQINPAIQYIRCGEILNPLYALKRWDVRKKQKHRIFVSQGAYALKGLHMLLEALPYLFGKYPDCTVYIAGTDLTRCEGMTDRLKRTTYARFLMKRMKQLNIAANRVHFTGPLNAEEMVEQYLSCHVFVLPSAIENSPNSLGEAMRLGVPCVASCVGGVQDMLRDRVDGFLYPFDEPYMMAHYMERFFESDELCVQMGSHAREHAAKRFQAQEVVETTLQVYRKIVEKQGPSHADAQ